jgi:hypothetical protein
VVYSHDATFALAYLANIKEMVSRKYAKDIWVVNLQYFVNTTFTEIRGSNVAPWQSSPEYVNNYSLLREHLLNRYNAEMEEIAGNQALAVSCPRACSAFELAAVMHGFNHPSRAERMLNDTPPPRQRTP